MAPIRLADSSDLESLAVLRTALWPESAQNDHAKELAAILDGSARRVLPLAIFIAEDDHSGLVGFLQAGLRSGADGCDESRPVGYVEGWYPAEQFRCQGIGTALLLAAEPGPGRKVAPRWLLRLQSKANSRSASMNLLASRSPLAASSTEKPCNSNHFQLGLVFFS